MRIGVVDDQYVDSVNMTDLVEKANAADIGKT